MIRLLMPLIHVGKAESEDKAVSTEVKTAIVDTLEKQSRVVLQYNHDISIDPSGVYYMQGEMAPYHAAYCMATMRRIKGFMFNAPDAQLYVTHTLKRFDIIDIVTDTQMLAIDASVTYYLEQTMQSADNFELAYVFDTNETIHAGVINVAHTPSYDGGGIGVLDILNDERLPFSDSVYVAAAHAFYPVHVELASAMFKFSRGAVAEYTFGAEIVKTANKRAML